MPGLMQNFQNLVQVDRNPTGTADLVRLGDGVTSFDFQLNEKVSANSFLDDDGGETPTVTGFAAVAEFGAIRVIGDSAQDYIASKAFKMGDGRNSKSTITMGDGTVISGPMTIMMDGYGGGDSGENTEWTFRFGFQGRPTVTEPVAATTNAGVIAAGSVSGTTKFTLTPGAGNSLAYKLTTAALTPKGREYVGDATSYTSAANIPATTGQILNVFELDAYYHIVTFKSGTVTLMA